ncbi:MAG: hypothetical protein HY056_11520 [Proteobacteria bacterium]|nr:hypothetical protein [Pseudomonadota bacterium]
MSGKIEETPEHVLDEAALEQAREYREGLLWWAEARLARSALETPPPPLPPSSTEISQRAFDMIVFFEVTSEALYTQKYRMPIWPKGASGVTIGIGYDVGYANRVQLRDDWAQSIPDAMIRALEAAIGVTGEAARPLAAALGASVDVPWQAASAVHRRRVIPRWVSLVERSLGNTARIGADCLGALVSLTYNRGASFTKDGDRYREMRAIREHMAAKEFARIPGELRAMRRLWPEVPGLQARRNQEAKLFEDGLRAIPVV